MLASNTTKNIFLFSYSISDSGVFSFHSTQGDVVYQTSYDAFGRERNPATAMYNNLTPRPAWLIRGYTGHEMMNEFGLINMNGRLYDPTIARMLSPDKFSNPSLCL
jgi:RHS repeat-associated protein